MMTNDSQAKFERLLDIENLLKEEKDLDIVAERIITSTYSDPDISRKDALDRFLEFIFFKIKTGDPYIINLAYPSKRMTDKELEKRIITLLNVHLFPDIVLKILRHFTRNTKNADTNLYLAYLIVSDEIITSIYETFKLFKKDINETDPNKRNNNVKKIQQFINAQSDSETSSSSPLDAACRFKYILEFIAIKQNVKHLYTFDDIQLSK